MSTKTTSQQHRRTPLSLTGGVSKGNPNQYSGKSADTNGNSNSNANAKNDNKLSASQKLESATNNTDNRESTPKDVKKTQNNTDKRQTQQQQNANNTELTKKNEKADDKKIQNGAGKAATNSGAKDKQQNGSDKQENGNGNSNGSSNSNGNSNASTTTRSSNATANSNANAKCITKTNERSSGTSTPTMKEDVKGKEEQKPNVKGTTRSSEKAAAASASASVAAKEDAKPEEQKSTHAVEKPENETEKEKEKEAEKDKEKKKESAPEKEKVVEKETRSRRLDAAAAETEKKQSDKSELPTNRSNTTGAQSKTRATPTSAIEKSSGASTPTKIVEKSGASSRTRSVTTVIDDVQMETVIIDSSPEKPQKNTVTQVNAAPVIQPPAATSTPGKSLFNTQQKTKLSQNSVASKCEIPLTTQSSDSPPNRDSAPRTFSQIGGRRSIRPLSEYTPSKFQSNLQFRESYRRINTELDVSSTTNTSMNVTVGSEVPNSSSFSFFGRGRKRDRTPPPHQQQSQSAMELQNDADYSPPKRARYDMYTFFSVVSSPITLLRSRFSKASIQSSTPVKLSTKLTAAENDETEVQNVSGISIEEEIIESAENEEKTATEDVTVGKKTDDDNTPKQLDSPMKVDDEKSGMEKVGEISGEKGIGFEPTNVHEVAAGIADTSVSSAVKNRRCNVM